MSWFRHAKISCLECQFEGCWVRYWLQKYRWRRPCSAWARHSPGLTSKPWSHFRGCLFPFCACSEGTLDVRERWSRSALEAGWLTSPSSRGWWDHQEVDEISPVATEGTLWHMLQEVSIAMRCGKWEGPVTLRVAAPAILTACNMHHKVSLAWKCEVSQLEIGAPGACMEWRCTVLRIQEQGALLTPGMCLMIRQE